MEMGHEVDGVKVRGKREMHELAVSAFTALEHGELTELFDSLHQRFFSRRPDELMEVHLVGNVCEWRFKPMIELLLRHIRDSAANMAVPSAQREHEIRWALEMAGLG
jgi:hypothetical protein